MRIGPMIVITINMEAESDNVYFNPLETDYYIFIDSGKSKMIKPSRYTSYGTAISADFLLNNGQLYYRPQPTGLQTVQTTSTNYGTSNSFWIWIKTDIKPLMSVTPYGMSVYFPISGKSNI